MFVLFVFHFLFPRNNLFGCSDCLPPLTYGNPTILLSLLSSVASCSFLCSSKKNYYVDFMLIRIKWMPRNEEISVCISFSSGCNKLKSFLFLCLSLKFILLAVCYGLVTNGWEIELRIFFQFSLFFLGSFSIFHVQGEKSWLELKNKQSGKVKCRAAPKGVECFSFQKCLQSLTKWNKLKFLFVNFNNLKLLEKLVLA